MHFLTELVSSRRSYVHLLLLNQIYIPKVQAGKEHDPKTALGSEFGYLKI